MRRLDSSQKTTVLIDGYIEQCLLSMILYPTLFFDKIIDKRSGICPSLLSIGCDKDDDQKQLGEEGAYLAYTSQTRPIIQGSQGPGGMN